jgi:hypothetical protein
MRFPSRWLLGASLAAALGSVLPQRSWAQNNRVPDAQVEEPGWLFTFAPNMWISALSGRVGIGSSVSEVDLSFDEIFDGFDIAVMGLFEARRHPWVVLADLRYVSLSDEEALSADGSGTVQVDQREFILHPELGYTVLARAWGGIDGLVGARYWNLSVDLSTSSAALSGDRNWIDGTVGARLRYQPAERWHLFVKSDVGAGGSDFSWQAHGGAGYDVGRCCTLDAAYRYLAVDYERDDLVYDINLSGPAVGVTLHF